MSKDHGPALAQRIAMRLQLIGNFSLDEFQEAVSVVIEDLKSSKVDSLRNVNIYAGICVQGIETQFMDGDSEIQHMVYDLRRQRQISLSSAKMSEDSLARLKKKSEEEE